MAHFRFAVYGTSRIGLLHPKDFHGNVKVRCLRGKTWRYIARKAKRELKHESPLIVYLVAGWCDMTIKDYYGRITIDPAVTVGLLVGEVTEAARILRAAGHIPVICDVIPGVLPDGTPEDQQKLRNMIYAINYIIDHDVNNSYHTPSLHHEFIKGGIAHKNRLRLGFFKNDKYHPNKNGTAKITKQIEHAHAMNILLL